MVKKKCFNFCQMEIDCLLELIDEMLPISGKEWEELASQHHSFFPEQDCNTDPLKQKFCTIIKKGPPTGSSNCPEYVRYAKAIMNKIAIKTDGSTGSGVAGEISENFDSEFGNANKDNNDNDDKYNGIGSDDSGLKRKEGNLFFDIVSNQPPTEDTFVKISTNLSKQESRQATMILSIPLL